MSLSLWKVILLFAWLFCLLSSTFRLIICLSLLTFLSDVLKPKGSNFFNPVGWKRNTCILAINGQTFLAFLIVNFQTFSCIRNPNWRDNMLDKNLWAVIWLVKTNKRILMSPAVLSGEECGLISQTVAGNQAYRELRGPRFKPVKLVLKS